MRRTLLIVLGAPTVVMALAAGHVAEQTDTNPWGLPNDHLLGFIEISAGAFLMGSDRSQDPQAEDDEFPQHRVTLPAFFIGRHEVTVAQFGAFVDDSGYRVDLPQQGPPDDPVTHVSWYDAVAYGAWLTEQLRRWEGTPEPLADVLRRAGTDRQGSVTLPSEAEWEKAARGTDGQIYPSGTRDYFAITAAGGSPSGASPYGALEMTGSVFEWTRSLSGPTFEYPYEPDDGREDVSAPDTIRRVVRGGAHYPGAPAGGTVSAAFRNWFYPFNRDSHVGFRVVVSPFSSGL